MCTLVFFRIYEGKKYFAVTLGKKRANGVKEECEAVVIFSAGKRILYNAVPYAGKKEEAKGRYAMTAIISCCLFLQIIITFFCRKVKMERRFEYDHQTIYKGFLKPLALVWELTDPSWRTMKMALKATLTDERCVFIPNSFGGH